METQEYLRQAMQRFARTQHAHHKLFDRMAGKFGMHRSQHHMLMDLARFGRPVSQKEIAERQGVTPAAVTHTLQKMEAAGFVERTTDQKDNRFNLIRLSEKGRSVAEETYRWFVGADRAMFAGFSDEDLAEFIAATEKIEKNLADIEAGILTVSPLDDNGFMRMGQED